MADSTSTLVNPAVARAIAHPPAGHPIPDAALPLLHERLGVDHVIAIPGAPHSPHRVYLTATVAAILRAVG